MPNEVKYLLRVFSIWMIGSLITYGHMANQGEREYKECLKKLELKTVNWCDSTYDVGAWLASITAWPYHWSKELWK